MSLLDSVSDFLLESIQQLEDVLKPFIREEENGGSSADRESSNPSIKQGAETLFASMRGYLQAIDECAAHQGMILNSVLVSTPCLRMITTMHKKTDFSSGRRIYRAWKWAPSSSARNRSHPTRSRCKP